MLTYLKNCYKKYLEGPECSVLTLLLILGATFVWLTGSLLAPVFVGLIIAYLLQSLVTCLKARGVGHNISVAVVFGAFLSLFIFSILFVLPLIWQQLVGLVQELPNMLAKTQELLYELEDNFPQLFTVDNIDGFILYLNDLVKKETKTIVAFSIATIPNVLLYMVYMVLIPIIVFFMLKDSPEHYRIAKLLLPVDRRAVTKIAIEVDRGIGNYIRGKVIEFMVITVANMLLFLYYDLPYNISVSIFLGLTVFVPYVGTVIGTIPIVLVGIFHLGFTTDFFYYFAIFTITQLLDANVLIPILFSNAVSIPPLFILISILFFGGLFGIWGVFFAIPLAVFIKAVFNTWPVNT